MTTLIPRKATTEDKPAVIDFYAQMIDEMKGTDFDVLWKHDVHPSHAFLCDAVEEGSAYIGIAEDGRIACAMIVDKKPAPGYENVPWPTGAAASEAGVLHVVATLPAYHGKGFARQLLQFAIDCSRAEGLQALRLDTFVDNVRSHGLYEKMGFINVGTYPITHADLGTVQLDMFELAL